MATTRAADGTTIDYDEVGSGDGPAVILVHGITESRESWDPIATRLARDHRVITMDLRGHGRSGMAKRYDLEVMAADVVGVAQAAGADRPHLVGHSLGGAVVSAVGAVYGVSSVACIDQPLQLAEFKAQVVSIEEQLRDPEVFPLAMHAVFEAMAGDRLSADETARLSALRRPDQAVVLGVWDLLLTASTEEITAAIEGSLAGYLHGAVPYLGLFGIDPGPDYADWLSSFVPTSTVEVWDHHGHYPHLVDPDRFVSRMHSFWE